MINEFYQDKPALQDLYLAHYGVKGMKWGVRKKYESRSRWTNVLDNSKSLQKYRNANRSANSRAEKRTNRVNYKHDKYLNRTRHRERMHDLRTKDLSELKKEKADSKFNIKQKKREYAHEQNQFIRSQPLGKKAVFSLLGNGVWAQRTINGINRTDYSDGEKSALKVAAFFAPLPVNYIAKRHYSRQSE